MLPSPLTAHLHFLSPHLPYLACIHGAQVAMLEKAMLQVLEQHEANLAHDRAMDELRAEYRAPEGADPAARTDFDTLIQERSAHIQQTNPAIKALTREAGSILRKELWSRAHPGENLPPELVGAADEEVAVAYPPFGIQRDRCPLTMNAVRLCVVGGFARELLHRCCDR